MARRNRSLGRVSMAKAVEEPSPPEPSPQPSLPPVDVVRLVVLVRLRRGLRRLALAAAVALPVWFIVVVTMIGLNDEGSATRAWFEDHANRGFVVILAVLVVDLALMLTVRRAGDVGALAAQFVPVVRTIPLPWTRTAVRKPVQDRLLDAGSRGRRVFPPETKHWLTLLFGLGLILLITISASTGTDIPTQYRASHGIGGPVVTIGKDAAVKRDENPYDSEDTSFYVSTPAGDVLIENAARAPETGTRFVIVSTYRGLSAVEIGGSDWITSLVVCIISGLIGLVVLFFFAGRLRRRTPDDRIVPLATTLDELARGKQITLQLVPPDGRSTPGSVRTLSAESNKDQGPDELAEHAERQARRATTGVVVLLALVGFVTAIV